MFIINTFSTCFGHHYAHLQWYAALVLLDVVGSSSGALAPYNRYQPHPAVPAQHTTGSNTCLGLLKMGIMMPETY